MSNMLLIDLSSIAHPIFHMSASEPDPNATSAKTVARVRALASGQPHVAVCCDSGRSFRKDVSADYKAQRPESDATLQHQIALAMEILRGDGFPVWAVKGFEADDLIATAVYLADGGDGHTVSIASADKDLLQLVNDRVTIHSLRDGSKVDAGTVYVKFGVKPEQIRDYLSLVGDSSDNIHGAKGVGPKRAVELLTAHQTIEGIYEALSKQPTAFSPSIATSLREFAPRLATVRELITLMTDVPVPFYEIFKERMPADTAIFGDEEPSAEDIATDIDEAMPTLQAPAPCSQAIPPEGVEREKPAAATVEARGTSQLVDGAAIYQGRRIPTPLKPTPERPQAPARGPIEAAASAIPTQAVTRAVEAEVLPPPVAEFTMQLEPRSMGQAKQLSVDLFASRQFSAYGNAPAVLSTIMAGRELGFQAMASLRAFHIIEGKPSLSAGAIHSLVLTSGKAQYFRCTERAATQATFETKRGDDPPIALTFTLAEARQAWAKDEKAWLASGWGKNQADMLVARALTKLARLVYPDVVHGLYAPEEME